MDYVIWESSGRSSGGRVGRQLGRLGPLTGRQVFLVGRTHLSGMAVSLIGGEPGVPVDVKSAHHAKHTASWIS
jgi:hypothetical protein